MNKRLKYSIFVCLLFSLTIGASAEKSSDEPSSFDPRSQATYFRVGESRFEPNYQGNAERMLFMRDFLRDLIRDSMVVIDSVVIHAAASPEGDPAVNKRLSDQRAAAIYDQVVSLVPELAPKILTHSMGEDWEGLHQAVVDDPNVPDRQEVLNILSLSSNRKGRELFLRELHGGNAWRYIAANILPQLRSCGLTLVHYRRLDQIQEEVALPSRDTVYIIQRDTIYINAPEPVASPDVFRDTVVVAMPTTIVSVAPPSELTSWGHSNDRPVWALKTNLINWALLQGNVEAEFYIGNHWSLNFEYQVAWWSNAARHQYYQYMHCGPEGRYWFKGNGQFRGHYVGLHVGFGLYDLSLGIPKDEPTGKSTYLDYQGFQGEFAIAMGISYGHVWRIGKYLNLELGLGFGYIMTEYRRYNYQDTHYVYQATERMQFVGPTKARLSLLWQFGRGAGKGIRR